MKINEIKLKIFLDMPPKGLRKERHLAPTTPLKHIEKICYLIVHNTLLLIVGFAYNSGDSAREWVVIAIWVHFL